MVGCLLKILFLFCSRHFFLFYSPGWATCMGVRVVLFLEYFCFHSVHGFANCKVVETKTADKSNGTSSTGLGILNETG